MARKDFWHVDYIVMVDRVVHMVLVGAHVGLGECGSGGHHDVFVMMDAGLTF